MKSKIVYIGLAAMVGLLAGYLIFGTGSIANSHEEHSHVQETEIPEMWTCSMHPQIMQPEPGDCPICGMDLIPADTGEGSLKDGQEKEISEMWTCSMHPQIMRSEPGDCPICGMDLIPTDTGKDGLNDGQFKMSENAMALADIKTTKVGTSVQGQNTLKLSGTIKENEKAIATQAAYFNGRIEELFVNFKGEEVISGQLLATIYSPELVSAQQELITAASLKDAQPELYQAVRNKLKFWKLSENQIEKFQITRGQ